MRSDPIYAEELMRQFMALSHHTRHHASSYTKKYHT
jgi:hypothetical protein